MYTREELIALGEEEDELTEEELLLLLAVSHTTLSDLKNEISSFYQKYGKDGVVTYSEARKWVSSKNHTKRLILLNQTILGVFENGFNNFETSFANHLQSIIKQEADFFGVDIDVDDILSKAWGVDESTWLKRLTAHRSKWATQIIYDLKLSVLKQDSILDVLTQITKRGQSMDTILARLWRTEANAVSSLARQKIFKELGITKYRFIHVDGCTCEKCSDMHNKVFPISEYVVGITANPLHPNCKDRTEPIME